MCKNKAVFLMLIFTTFSLSGCLESDNLDSVITHQFLETKNCGSRGIVNISNLSLYECQIIPLFDFYDDSGFQNKFVCSMNETIAKTEVCSLKINEYSVEEVWIAYFSTPWCTHCETTLNAYDEAIPENRMLIFNKDSNPKYSNMTEWKQNTSERIGREINRPFIQAPNLATELGVTGIPMAFFIDIHGVVIDYSLGKRSNVSEIKHSYEAALILENNYSESINN
ncbi:MAG: hypothetical protein CMB56_003400 [Methanobacteriota archaeon]|nr:MAG: hypothetical protein CMB56_003400 [Euryarchaeota archaeon]|tara:strand:- start:67 stop:741 length:675 start_codon:yes stop_codon:yes gene_type:complete